MDNIEEFKAYLKQQHRLKESTANEHISNVQRFMHWLTKEHYSNINTVRYNDLLAYIQHEKNRQIDAATINLRLASISYYFGYLKEQGEVERNPAKTIRVKGIIKKVIEHPLTADELNTLYHAYCSLHINSLAKQKTIIAHQRNTVIAGLLIYQGVHSGELPKMETGHINLKEATVYIPSTTKSNSRQLSLSPAQMLWLHEYIQDIRPRLKSRAGELIPGSVRNIILQLTQELQGINPAVKNAQHIRGSVILNWLKQYNKRQVQYMAGHKYISSTEKYAVQEMETLQESLSKHHPFG